LTEAEPCAAAQRGHYRERYGICESSDSRKSEWQKRRSSVPRKTPNLIEDAQE
jgi:hypothetical protein